MTEHETVAAIVKEIRAIRAAYLRMMASDGEISNPIHMASIETMNTIIDMIEDGDWREKGGGLNANDVNNR